MIDFATAWTYLDIGDEVAVADGAPEPPDPSGVEYRIWRSHNFTGAIAEKIEGAPRQLRIELPATELGTVSYLIAEGVGHSFVPSSPPPALAYAVRWDEAKAHSVERAAAGFVLPGVGTIQTDAVSREAIGLLVDEARDRIAAGETDWTTAFVNEENAPVPVTAPQILAIYAALRAYLGACYAARQNVRAQLDSALAAASSGADLLTVDITKGYP